MLITTSSCSFLIRPLLLHLLLTTHATITIILSITKTGDPFVFGRGGEEVLEFREFGVEPSIIPVS